MKLNLHTTHEIISVLILGVATIAGLYGAVGVSVAGVSIYLLGTIIQPKENE